MDVSAPSQSLAKVGIEVGAFVGEGVGKGEGGTVRPDGAPLGASVDVGALDGMVVGSRDGIPVGAAVDGVGDGMIEGSPLGFGNGEAVAQSPQVAGHQLAILLSHRSTFLIIKA